MSNEYFGFDKASERFEGKRHLIAHVALQSLFKNPEEIEIALNEMMTE